MPAPRTLCSALCSLLLAAAAFLAAAPAQAQYFVGKTSVFYNDPARSNRQVGVELYYPATAAGTNTPIAPPPAGGFHVVVYGHGFAMSTQVYSNIWDAIVPLGYIVALPTTEGSVLPAPSHGAFGADLAFVANKIRSEGANVSSFLYGRVGANAALMGHSMGGGASFLGAASNPTVQAVANMGAANTSPSAITAAASVPVPTLVLVGDEDCVAPPGSHALPMYNASTSTCKTYVNILNANHCQFAQSGSLCELGQLTCGNPGLSRAQQQAKVNEFLLPWLDGVLKADWQRWQQYQAAVVLSAGVQILQSCPVNPAPPPQCANGIDDDGDGKTDWSATLGAGDDGCRSQSDPTERPDCQDTIDNDGDGQIDSNDAGCHIAQQSTEKPQCQDGVDNDGDTKIDYSATPGAGDDYCIGAWDDDEASNPPNGCGLLGIEALVALGLRRWLGRGTPGAQA